MSIPGLTTTGIRKEKASSMKTGFVCSNGNKVFESAVYRIIGNRVWLPMLPGTGLWMQRWPSTNPVRIAVINMFIMPVNCPVCLPDKKELFHERN